MKDLRILDARAVRRALPMTDAIAAMRDVFARLGTADVDLPERTVLAAEDGAATLLAMPGRIPGRFGIGAKLVSVQPANASAGRPVVQAVMVVLDAETGTPAALLDGTALTAIRTGAVSGLATDLLASPSAATAAILGAGVQARTQLEAVCTVRSIGTAWVWSRTPAHAERFAAEMAGRGPVPADLRVAPSAAAAVREAAVVCTATSATEPILRADEVPDGVHLNAVGSFTPAMRELDPALLAQALVVVDRRAAALAEAGEVIAAVERHGLAVDALVEIADILRSGAPPPARGRLSVFKSVGLAIQDLAAAAAALEPLDGRQEGAVSS